MEKLIEKTTERENKSFPLFKDFIADLIDFEAAKRSPNFTVRDALKRIFPARHVHELRYSFITRANVCVQ